MSTSEKDKGLNRRRFLKQGAGLVLASGFFSSAGLRRALAAARKKAAPLLTPSRVENNIPPPGSAEFHQHIDACKENPRAYLEQHFYLTPQQRNAIDGLSPADREKLNQALDTAEQRKLKIHVRHVFSQDKFSVQPQVQADSLIIRTSGNADCPNRRGPTAK